MTREEIKNTPELVDFMLDKCVLADSRTKVRKRLEEVCDLAIKALDQQPTIANIPYLMHKEMDISISECQKAYDVAIDYLRRQGKVKG